MKQYLNLFIFFMLVFSISSISVSAYNATTNLYDYYTMGDGVGANHAYGSKLGTFQYFFRTATSTTGLQGNAFRWTYQIADRWTDGFHFGNDTGMNLENNDFSFNYWLYQIGTGNYNGWGLCAFPANSVCQRTQYSFTLNSTHIKNVIQIIYGGSSSTITLNNVYINTWNMITFNYNKTTSTACLYINSISRGCFSTNNLPADINSINIRASDGIVDEYSLWNNYNLNAADIAILYHNGTGLNYNETTLSGQGYTNGSYTEAQSNTTSDGYYHNYCWYDVACRNYNITADWCIDDPRIWCDINCADTFDSYTPAQRLNISSFGAECYAGAFHYVNKTQPGNVYGNDYKSICFGDYYLCYNLNISRNDSCPVYLNGVLNRVDCRNVYGSIGQCKDDRDIFESLNSYPITMNYSGHCVSCVSDCTQENSTQCNGDIQQVCKPDKDGCSYFIDEYLCAAGCANNRCNAVTPVTPSAVLTGGQKVFVLFIALLIVLGACVGIGYGSNMPQFGFALGAFLDIFLIIAAAIPDFPYIGGFIPVWFAIILGLLCIIIAIALGVNFLSSGREG